MSNNSSLLLSMVELINNSTIEIANRIEKVKLVHEEEALWNITVRLCTLSAPFTDRFIVGFKFKRYPENPRGLCVCLFLSVTNRYCD